jgi:hypothetical protein
MAPTFPQRRPKRQDRQDSKISTSNSKTAKTLNSRQKVVYDTNEFAQDMR